MCVYLYTKVGIEENIAKTEYFKRERKTEHN